MFNTAQEIIIDRFKHPLYAGKIEKPDLVAEGANLFCGDEITMELTHHNGVIHDIKHHCRACAICSASADLLAEILIGKNLSDIQKITQDEATALLGIPLSPIRIKCALLPLETLKTIFYNYQALVTAAVET